MFPAALPSPASPVSSRTVFLSGVEPLSLILNQVTTAASFGLIIAMFECRPLLIVSLVIVENTEGASEGVGIVIETSLFSWGCSYSGPYF